MAAVSSVSAEHRASIFMVEHGHSNLPIHRWHPSHCMLSQHAEVRNKTCNRRKSFKSHRPATNILVAISQACMHQNIWAPERRARFMPVCYSKLRATHGNPTLCLQSETLQQALSPPPMDVLQSLRRWILKNDDCFPSRTDRQRGSSAQTTQDHRCSSGPNLSLCSALCHDQGWPLVWSKTGLS